MYPKHYFLSHIRFTVSLKENPPNNQSSPCLPHFVYTFVCSSLECEWRFVIMSWSSFLEPSTGEWPTRPEVAVLGLVGDRGGWVEEGERGRLEGEAGKGSLCVRWDCGGVFFCRAGEFGLFSEGREEELGCGGVGFKIVRSLKSEVVVIVERAEPDDFGDCIVLVPDWFKGKYVVGLLGQ